MKPTPGLQPDVRVTIFYGGGVEEGSSFTFDAADLKTPTTFAQAVAEVVGKSLRCFFKDKTDGDGMYSLKVEFGYRWRP